MTHQNLLSKFRRPVWLVLIMMPLILFWRIVLAGRVLVWGVPLLQFYPWQQWAVEMWRSGHVPLWNPWLGNGAPLAANLQSAVFYPLNALYLVLPVEQAMGYTAVLHVMLAGLALYAWGRAFGLRPLAALVGALAFQLSQFLIARLGFVSITATFPWTAVWLWRAEVFAQRRRPSDVVWLALSIGMGLLAGHAQTAGLGLIVMVLYATIRMAQEARSKTQNAGHSLRASVIGLSSSVVLGFALTAVQLLPASELTAQSQRSSGLDYEFAVTHSLHPLRLLTFFAPDLMGHPADGNFWGYDNYWENAGYVGVWALLMAAFAISNFKSQNSKGKVVVLFFAAVMLVSLLIALGRFALFYGWLFRALPGASLFQGPARLLSVYTLAVGALAALGLEQLLTGNRLRWSGRLMLAAAVSVLLATMAGVAFIGIRGVFVRPAIQFGVTLAACAACLAFRPSLVSRRFKWWGAALVSIVALDLLAADWRLNPTAEPALYRAPTASAQAVRAAGPGRLLWFEQDQDEIKFERYFSFKTFGPERADYWLGLRETLLPNAAMLDRLPAANNFDSLLPGRYNELMARLNHLPESNALKLAGLMDARYIVSPRELALPVVQRGADVTVYRNDAALGRAWIVPQARVADDALAALADPAFDARRTVVLESGASLPRLEFPAGRSSVTLRDSPNAVTILAASDSGGFLVQADTHYPGWQATLDGAPVKIMRANHAFRAVVLPPGEHTVVFQYVPLTFRVGTAISLTALAILVSVLIVVLRQRRTRL